MAGLNQVIPPVVSAQLSDENPSPVLRVGADGTLLYANPSSKDLLVSWNCRLGQRVPEQLQKQVRVALQSHRSVELEDTWGEQILTFIFTPFPSQQYVNLYGRDISKRKRAESQVRAIAEQLRSFFELSPDLMAVAGSDGVFKQLSPSWEATLGYSVEEMTSEPWLHFVHPDDHEKTIEAFKHVVAGESLSLFLNRYRRKNGDYRWIEWHCTSATEQQLIYCIARDVTERKVAEEALQQANIQERHLAERRRSFTNTLLALFAQKTSAKDYLDSVVQVLQEWSGCQALGIRIVDEERRIPYQAWAGFEQGFIELEHALSLDHDTCCCTRAISQAFEEQDRPLLTPGGSYHCADLASFIKGLSPEKSARYQGNCSNFGFASVAVTPIRYRDKLIGAIHLADRRPGEFQPAKMEFIESITPLIGEAIHRFQAEAELAKYRDHLEVLVHQRTREFETANARLQVEIAERQRAQETLQQTAEELRRSNRDLEQFAYVASHDLQEPLRAVGGYVKLLQRRFPDSVDPKAFEYIAGASDGAARMERLITDLLDFARVGTRGAAFTPTRLDPLLDDALNNLQTAIRTSEATITRDPLPTLEIDPTQIMQLFQNLIANAIKFRSAEPPRIHIGGGRQEGLWIISVRDNGIGIDQKYFQRIFQIFQRLHTRKHYPGTGIGLAICKRIAERHSGTIWVESETGRGSTFYFSIPEIPAIR